MRTHLNAEEILAEIEKRADPRRSAEMARVGIVGEPVLGVPVPELRGLARRVGRDHAVAAALWAAGSRESRLVAAFIEEPAKVTATQMDAWAMGFRSWEVCDQVVAEAFQRSAPAYRKAFTWSRRKEAFVKRAGLVLMARIAAREQQRPDDELRPFLAAIEVAAADERPIVQNAASWALREIGQRGPELREEARVVAERLAGSEDRALRWVGKDALRELRE